MKACTFSLVTCPVPMGLTHPGLSTMAEKLTKVKKMKFRSKYLMSGVLMLLLVSLTLIGSVSAETKINSLPYTITAPGTYVLQHDIHASEAPVGITVMASDVTIDGKNLEFDEVEHLNTIGIKVSSYMRCGTLYTPTNVKIHNFKISGFATGIVFDQVKDSVITKNDFIGNTNGVTLKSTTHTTISANTFNKDTGVGITAGSGSTETSILTNTFNSEKLAMQLNSGSTTATIRGNKVLATTDPEDAENIGIKIDGSSGNAIYNNLFNTFNNVKATNTANSWCLPSLGRNIAGGPSIGGNAWMMPDDTGFSQLKSDDNGDGFVDTPYIINNLNKDVMPLKV